MPQGSKTTVWRNWRRCVRRGYRKDTQEDWKDYETNYGSNPRQGKVMETTTRVDTVSKTVTAYTAQKMGQRAFYEFKNRIEAGMCPEGFSVFGNEIRFTVKEKKVVKERRAR